MEKKAQSSDVPDEIRLVRQHQKLAFKYISKALDLDEKQDKHDERYIIQAISFYEKGINELQQGILYELDGEGADWDKARTLQVKMQSNLSDSFSRLEELRKCKTTTKKKPSTDGTKPVVSGKKGPIGSAKGQRIENGKRPSSAKTQPTNPKGGPGITRSLSAPRPSTAATAPQAKNNIRLPSAEQEKKVSNLKNVDTKLANMILNDVIERKAGVTFDDVGGAELAKQTLREIVILPSLRPELFTGLRVPSRGVLLFGPPGNGKTLLAKAVASEANSVFFNISAASLTSKFVGEGEKMVKALFAVAREVQPSIIFIDEIDSLLTERKDSEHEASRRLKTEFLLCFDGMASDPNERILLMGATNRPWELDDAARRRLTKRIYLPLPDEETRKQILEHLLEKQNSPLSESDLKKLSRMTSGYSGSDLAALARDAALMPIREIDPSVLQSLPADKVRRIKLEDFNSAMKTIRPSVSEKYLSTFAEWNKDFGCLS